jgi:TPR repeat protein
MRHLVALTMIAAVALPALPAGADGPPGVRGLRRRLAREMGRQDKACQKGDASACVKLGELHVRLYFEDKDDTDIDDGALAFAAFDRACTLGSMDGCGQRAWCYTEGLGVKADRLEAVKLFEAPCQAGDASSCALLADLIWTHSETTVPQDPQRALALYQKVCDGAVAGLGCSSGCNRLASFYYYGMDMVKKDRERAAGYYDRACVAGCLDSCHSLGNMARDGDGIAVDPVRAAAAYKAGCDGGFAPSCEGLGNLYRAGQGVAKNPARSKQLFARACRLSGGQLCPR